MNVKVWIRGAPQSTRQEIELQAVPTTIARNTLCDLVWDKLLAVQICTVFDGDAAAAPEDVPWDRDQGELVLTDESGAYVVGDTIDLTSIPLPLHAFELFVKVPIPLYRRILNSEVHPAVRSENQTQSFTRMSPVHLASIFTVTLR